LRIPAEIFRIQFQRYFPARKYRLVQKYLPLAVGVVLACMPLAGFTYWLDGHVESQGRNEVQFNAGRAITIINARLSRVVSALNSLAIAGATSCSPEHVEQLRKTAFLTSPVKELSVIGVDGKPACSDTGLVLGAVQIIGTQSKTRYPNIMIDVLHLTDMQQNMVRVHRLLNDGKSIAALLPADLFVPIASADANTGNAHVRITGPDGADIAEVNGKVIAGARPGDLFSTTMESESFGIRATVSRTRSQILDRQMEMRVGGIVVSLVFGAAILTLVWFLSRRREIPDIAAEYSAALARGEFVPFYQPIIDIVSGKLIGAEVLVRWKKPDGSLVGPGAFIPVMEQNGLIADLSRHLMRQSVNDIGPAYGKRPNLRVSFNLTAEQIENDATVGEIRSIFARSPIRLSQVVLELTERQEPKSFQKTRQVIASLQVLGCKVALDDVGTGHSGLSSILKLGVDIIKIDKMFVDSMDDDRNSATIIGTLVDLGRKLGMDIVAEGVERFEQVVELRRRGIRAAQGFVFAPALPAESFLKLVEASTPQQASALGQAVETNAVPLQAAVA
jgi:sensor c-di-GMP phosphodiesterase-like protein